MIGKQEAYALGFVTCAFGLGSIQLQGEAQAFAVVHIVVGVAALLYAIARDVQRLRSARRDVLSRPVLRAFGVLLLTLVAGIGLERLAASSALRFDLTFEGEFHVAPATREALAELEGAVSMTLYRDPGDPRIRRTRMLLEEITRGREIRLTTRVIEDAPEDEDRYGIGSSNSVVVHHDQDWLLVERPTEGALFEAFARLGRKGDRVLYFSTGSGEGDIQEGGDTGFSGLAVGFQTEGFDVRVLPSPVMSEIPSDADLVVVLAPERNMRRDALAALTAYVERGGSVLAFIDPASESGLEGWLGDFGLSSPAALVVDPVSDPVDGEIRGLSPIVFNYGSHPVTTGLERNRNSVFRRARAFQLRKPTPEDRLDALVFTSPYAWLEHAPLPPGLRDLPERPASERPRYLHLAAAARYPRGEHEGRIVAFGDRDFVSNRYLRALYNLDLVMNAAHWAVAWTDRVTLRPKSAGLIQFPVPIQNSMKAFYGVGLLIPEILLIAGAVAWFRQRRA
ncbi:MAG: Gldg family protein [Myxococcota bacterium]|jgi:hypothetical protein|nr:Gldg family protein [Myxococcota bacterium]